MIMLKPGQKVKFRDVLGREQIGTVDTVTIIYGMKESGGDPHSVYSEVYEDQIIEST